MSSSTRVSDRSDLPARVGLHGFDRNLTSRSAPAVACKSLSDEDIHDTFRLACANGNQRRHDWFP